MDLPSKIMLPCGNAAILNDRENNYYCNYCNYVVGTKEEPIECRVKRESVERYKNDYWMNINDEPEIN